MNQKITVSLQIKAINQREFEGHGSVFGNVDYGGDVVIKGAFSRTLKEWGDKLPPMFWMHDPSRIPGKWIKMGEDDNGLYVKGILADTDLGNEVHTLLKMEAVRGMSFGYITREADYDKEGNRLLKDVDLIEVSVVSIPMNPKAQVAHVKSRLSARGEYVPEPEQQAQIKREIEKHIRTKGFSQQAAKAAVASLFGSNSAMLDEPLIAAIDDSIAKMDDIDPTPDLIEYRTAMNEINERLIADELARMRKRYI